MNVCTPRQLLALVLGALLLAGCASEEPAATASPAATAPAEVAPTGAADPASAPAAQVLVEVFSGRPDPSWVLSDDQSAQLIAALGALQPAAEGAPPPDRMGYRSFRVSLAEETGERWNIQAYDGLVRRERGGAVDFLADPQRSVELLLLGTAAGQLEPAVIEVIKQALGQ